MNLQVDGFTVEGDAPEWFRTVFVGRGKNDLFLPAAALGYNDDEAFLCAAYDGATSVTDDDGHVYLPSEWLIKGAREDDVAELTKLVEKIRMRLKI